MPLSTQQLRKEFKSNIELLIGKIDKTTISNQEGIHHLFSEIQKISEHLEKMIHEKVELLEEDFQDYPLLDDYLHTVTEGLDDLDRLLRSSKTFTDSVHGKSKEKILKQIKDHYANTLVPLLNIMAKLENDYISIATQTILKKREVLNQVQVALQKAKAEEVYIRKSVLILNKKKKLADVSIQIRVIDLKRKMLHLSLHHDRLNLYYFNHDHPMELREIKHKVDLLRIELRKFKEMNYEW